MYVAIPMATYIYGEVTCGLIYVAMAKKHRCMWPWPTGWGLTEVRARETAYQMGSYRNKPWLATICRIRSIILDFGLCFVGLPLLIMLPLSLFRICLGFGYGRRGYGRRGRMRNSVFIGSVFGLDDAVSERMVESENHSPRQPPQVDSANGQEPKASIFLCVFCRVTFDLACYEYYIRTRVRSFSSAKAKCSTNGLDKEEIVRVLAGKLTTVAAMADASSCFDC
ncbi:hypothetical protein Tco_0365304 [Tanacetum coccineum]